MNKHAPKFWSTHEVALLKRYHNIYTPSELVLITGRSGSSICSKTESLGLELTERKCRQCRELFMPVHRGHVYCCKRCKGKAYRARKLLDV